MIKEINKADCNLFSLWNVTFKFACLKTFKKVLMFN